MAKPSASHDPATIALMALGWIVSDTVRAERLLAISGLTPDQLRLSAGDPAVLAGIIAFLEAHEPDLVAAAEAIGVEPQEIITAGQALGS